MSQEQEKRNDLLDQTEEDASTDEESGAIRQLKAANVVPLHAATAPLKRGPGRPRKINPKPTPDDLAYHAEVQRQQIHFIEQDEIVKAADGRRDSIVMLQLLKQKIARSAAALEFQRVELQKYGKVQEATQVVTRQIAAIKELAAIELELTRKSDQLLDVRSEKVQKVFALFIERIREVAVATLTPQNQDLFFTRLESALNGWEDEAESRIR